MAKKTYVLDTSVCLTDAECVNSYGNNDIIIPLKVLEEIDKHKKRQDSVGLNARIIIRKLDDLRKKGDLQAGVRINKGKGLLYVRKSDVDVISSDLDKTVADHIILSTAIAEDQSNGNRKTIMVSRDINLRVISQSLGIVSEDYEKNKIINKESALYTGMAKCLVDEQIIEQFYAGEGVFIDEEETRNLYPNQFLMLVSSSNEKKTALCRFESYHLPVKKVINYNSVWGIKPRNKEQMFAMDLLMDPNVEIVSLVGIAGSGKTLEATASGLEQVIGNTSIEEMASGYNRRKSDSLYKKLIITRPVQPMGKDIGFLPGNLNEKMAPWLAPIQDQLRFLTGDDQMTLEHYMKSGVIEIEALTYIRGRSIANAFLIVDESQNLTSHEIKTIISRVGEGTKIVLTGDIEQIDNVYVDAYSSGLSHAVEKLKPFELSGHITLKKGERSRVATLASKVL